MSAASGYHGSDSEVDAFVAANLLSFAAWDLVIYFNRNPEARVTARGLAASLGRSPTDMDPALCRLVDNKVLLASVADDEASYRLSPDEGVRRIVSRFVSATARRDRRLEFVRRVLAQVTGG